MLNHNPNLLHADVFSYRLEVVAEVLQAGEPLPAGLAGVGPLPGVTPQVTLQVRPPLHRVRAERALETHPGQVTWQGQGTQQSFLAVLSSVLSLKYLTARVFFK